MYDIGLPYLIHFHLTYIAEHKGRGSPKFKGVRVGEVKNPLCQSLTQGELNLLNTSNKRTTATKVKLFASNMRKKDRCRNYVNLLNVFKANCYCSYSLA